jgi:integrase/recombinase XerC/integrase/recombinase XerD
MKVKIAVANKSKKLAKSGDFAGLIARFLAAQDVKPSSKKTYERSLRPFLTWLQRSGAQSPTRETVLSYKAALEAQGLSALTVSLYLVAVRKFFEWAESVKLYPNVARGVKGAKRSRGFMKDPLTVSQVKELLESVDRSTLQGKRDYALLNLLVRTGLRTVEATRANVGDIRQESGEVVLWIQGKGRDSKDEFVLLTAETLKPIQDYLGGRGGAAETSPLFASLSDRNRAGRLTTRTASRIAKTKLQGIGLDSERLTAHSLRHTAITLSLLGGATIQEAQALGRHSNINTTLIYAHNINRIAQAPERKIDALLAGGMSA